MRSNLGIAIQLSAQPVIPRGIEPDFGGDSIGGLESGRKSGFQRTLVEQCGSEGVDGLEIGLPETFGGVAAIVAFNLAAVRVGGCLFQLLPGAVAQLGGGGFGEGDGGDTADGRPPRRYQVYHPLH